MAHASCDPAQTAIALDTGHDKQRYGATSARGLPEWQFNHDLVLHLAEHLLALGRRPLVLAPAGEAIPLTERGGRAAAQGASLLLSIHHDSAQPRYLQRWQYGGDERRYSDRFHGFSLFVSERNGHFAESLRFAEQLGTALLAAGLSPTLHHAEPIPGEGRQLLEPRLGLYRFDDLKILHSTPLPAVLLEAGVIVNRDEELLVQTPAFRAEVAQAVATALDRWCQAE